MAKYVIVRLIRTSESYPAQWEGEDNEGNPIYILWHRGNLSVRRGHKDGDLISAIEGEEIFGKQSEMKWSDALTYDELKAMMWDYFDMPEEEEWPY